MDGITRVRNGCIVLLVHLSPHLVVLTNFGAHAPGACVPCFFEVVTHLYDLLTHKTVAPLAAIVLSPNSTVRVSQVASASAVSRSSGGG